MMPLRGFSGVVTEVCNAHNPMPETQSKEDLCALRR